LTGLFAAKKRGLFVGSTEEMEPVKDVVKRALAEEKGLVFFLWRNQDAEEGQPPYTLYMDVSQDMESKSQSKRRMIQQPEEEAESEADDDSLAIVRPTPKRKHNDVPF
jgi:hypothetical protein